MSTNIASVWSPTYNTRTVVNPIFDFISSCTNILKRDFLWIVWIAKWVFNDFVPCSITGRGTYAGAGCGGGFILDLFTPWCCPSSLWSPFLNSKKHHQINVYQVRRKFVLSLWKEILIYLVEAYLTFDIYQLPWLYSSCYIHLRSLYFAMFTHAIIQSCIYI